MVGPQPKKLNRGLRMTKAHLRRMKLSAAHIAGMVGTLLDLRKGNVALHGLAECIMREASSMLHGGVCWRAHTPRTGLVAEGSIGGLKHPVPHPIPQPLPPSQGHLLDKCERRELGGGVWEREGGNSAEFHHLFTHSQRVMHITLK